MAKKKSSPKSKEKKVSNVPDPIELTNEDRQKTVDKINKLKGNQVMTLPDEAIVSIPISGSYHKAIEGLFFYLMEPMNASEVLLTMNNIKNNFKDVPEEKISNRQRAIWTIMTLLSEIQWQADAQGKLVKTEQKVTNLVQDLLAGVDGASGAVAATIEAAKKSNED
tara:strand:+ start:473 stop:970 length:498 start_codon:yes stop_codon:yes gene_type:complete